MQPSTGEHGNEHVSPFVTAQCFRGLWRPQGTSRLLPEALMYPITNAPWFKVKQSY